MFLPPSKYATDAGLSVSINAMPQCIHLYGSSMVYNMAAQNKHSCGGASIDSPRDNTFNSAARAKSTDWLLIRLCEQHDVVFIACGAFVVGAQMQNLVGIRIYASPTNNC